MERKESKDSGLKDKLVYLKSQYAPAHIEANKLSLDEIFAEHVLS